MMTLWLQITACVANVHSEFNFPDLECVTHSVRNRCTQARWDEVPYVIPSVRDGSIPRGDLPHKLTTRRKLKSIQRCVCVCHFKGDQV